MESLQVLSYNAVLKYGCWHTSHIPDVLKNELRMSNRSIHSLMSGNGYYNYLASESVRFDVAWEDGSWCFRLMGGPLKLIPVVHATIYPNSITYMEDLWCEVFALSFTDAVISGFDLKDYKLSIETRKVLFYGRFVDQSHENINFQTEFNYQSTDCALHVKTFGWKNEEDDVFFHFETCFSKSSDVFWIASVLQRYEESLFDSAYS